MTTCKNCGGEIADTAKFCLKCGTKVERHPFCPNYGTELKPNTKFCSACGTQKADGQVPEQNHVLSQQMQTNSNIAVPLDKKERKEALFEAIKRNDANAVEAILKSGYKPNKLIGEVTPLGVAAIFDNADVAQVLIRHGAAVKGWRSITAWPPNHNPLMLAASS